MVKYDLSPLNPRFSRRWENETISQIHAFHHSQIIENEHQ